VNEATQFEKERGNFSLCYKPAKAINKQIMLLLRFPNTRKKGKLNFIMNKEALSLDRKKGIKC
jgi:hypothetical protein